MQQCLGEDRPATGHNIHVIIQLVVLAKQSDRVTVPSSHNEDHKLTSNPSISQKKLLFFNITFLTFTKYGEMIRKMTCFHSDLDLLTLYSPLFIGHVGTLKPGQHMCLIKSFKLRISQWSVLLT